MPSTRALSESFATPTRLPCTAESGPWRCFHCGELFETPAEAHRHFGHWEHEKPACQFTTKEIRELQLQLERYMDDDTDLHRQIHALESKLETEKRRAEEEGYALGLEHAKKFPGELGLQRIEPL